MTEDGSRSEELLELFECGLRIGSPLELRSQWVVLQQVVLRSKKVGNREYDARVREDETAVKIAESKEYLDIMNRLWNRPFGDALDTAFLHGDAVGRDNVAQKVDFLDRELAFLEGRVKSMLE